VTRDLAEIDDELARLIEEAHGWQVNLGRLTVRSSLSQQKLFILFVGFHSAMGLGGAALILKGTGRAADLGIALLVGALFGLGAFMAEVWGRTVDKTAWIREIAYGERTREHFRDLIARREAIRERDAAPESSPDAAHPGGSAIGCPNRALTAINPQQHERGELPPASRSPWHQLLPRLIPTATVTSGATEFHTSEP
jgi:hypothetical protein